MAAETDTNPLADLSREEQQALAEIASARVDGRISRRDAIKAAGLLGGGAAIGAGAGSQLVEPASAGSQQSGTIGTASDPVDVEAEDINASAVDTEELTNVQPTGTYDWHTVARIRRQGGVVASNGKVYQGASALQDAINAVGESGVVLAGADAYGPVTISESNVIVRGVGRSTTIVSASADTHPLVLEDNASGFIARVQVGDLTLDTTNASGAADCLHIRTPNGNSVYESWFTNVQMQGGGGRYGVNLTGATKGTYFTQLFGEGFDDHVFVTGQNTIETNVMGADLATNADVPIISLDGNNGLILPQNLTKPAGVAEVEFLSNSNNNLIVTAENISGNPTNNGANNAVVASNRFVQPGNTFIGNDNMTNDPETETEDGWLRVVSGGTTYEVPMYQR